MSSVRSSKKSPSVTAPADTAAPASEPVDTGFLRTLVGYNTRRAALSIIAVFMERMAVYDLKVVDFSVLSLVAHNPGITSRQLCDTLNLLPPNLVGKIGGLERRGLLLRHPHPLDRRAQSLQLTAEGQALMREAEKAASQLEIEVSQALSAAERRTLIRLLQKLYQG